VRINVYTEELINGGDQSLAEIVTTEYISSRTGEPMKNWGLRVFLKSAPDLHYIPGRDNDRSSITFWCGPSQQNIFKFLEAVKTALEVSNMDQWRDKVGEAAKRTEETIAGT